MIHGLIHGPCEGNKDSLREGLWLRSLLLETFPRPYIEETVIDQNSYPSHRCRANYFTFSATVKYMRWSR
jgi:hypothetical protein